MKDTFEDQKILRFNSETAEGRLRMEWYGVPHIHEGLRNDEYNFMVNVTPDGLLSESRGRPADVFTLAIAHNCAGHCATYVYQIKDLPNNFHSILYLRDMLQKQVGYLWDNSTWSNLWNDHIKAIYRTFSIPHRFSREMFDFPSLATDFVADPYEAKNLVTDI